MKHISVSQMLILAGSMHIINTCWGPEGTSGNIDFLRKAYWGHYSLHTHTHIYTGGIKDSSSAAEWLFGS